MRDVPRQGLDRLGFAVICLVLISSAAYMGWQNWKVTQSVEACERTGHIPTYTNHMEHGKYTLVSCEPPSTTIIVLPENIGPAITSPRDNHG